VLIDQYRIPARGVFRRRDEHDGVALWVAIRFAKTGLSRI
jgi:hypothetical protein